jgi:gamma-glutamyltranspeptidase/glutathione hydrolase
MMRHIVIVGLVVITAGSTVLAQQTQQEPVYRNAVVAADHSLASQAGLEMLKAGGNVVDAAVATSFALSVVRPASCGIGGGGFMVIWDADKQESVALDYRERAPLRATREMYVEANKKGTKTSEYGHLAIGVPGTVAGLCYAAEHYGSLPLAKLLEPAIRLARDGVPVDRNERYVQKSVLATFEKMPGAKTKYANLIKGYLNDGKPWTDEDRFHSPQLAALELIARDGPEAFYNGPIRDAIVTESRRGGGILSLDDFTGFQPVVRKPLVGTFDEFQILTMPPPSSGGVAIIQILNFLDEWESQHPGNRIEDLPRDSPEFAHLLIEAMKHAFADRAEYLGDMDFADVPVDRLICREYVKGLLAKFDPTRTKPNRAYGRFAPVEDSGTSHISVIDRRGNAVACTETVNTFFGSKVVEPRFGIVLNNEMDDFAAVPGEPNTFGLIQSEANAVEPRKKPLSSMSPTIVLEDGKARLVAGASGGPKIISATLQVLLNQMRFGMTPAQAVAYPRVHHQWLPDVLNVENGVDLGLREGLARRGHQVVQKSVGVSQSVSRSKDGLRGASDPRKYGQPAGY